jgi:hypothetical protein
MEYEGPTTNHGRVSVGRDARDPVVQVVVRLVKCEREYCDCRKRNACYRSASDATAMLRPN